MQDHISAGPFTANAGIRWDYYDLLLERMAWSPRLAVAWKAKPLGVVFSASYDRVFDTPPTENLLLASSPETRQVNPAVLGIPVPPHTRISSKSVPIADSATVRVWMSRLSVVIFATTRTTMSFLIRVFRSRFRFRVRSSRESKPLSTCRWHEDSSLTETSPISPERLKCR